MARPDDAREGSGSTDNNNIVFQLPPLPPITEVTTFVTEFNANAKIFVEVANRLTTAISAANLPEKVEDHDTRIGQVEAGVFGLQFLAGIVSALRTADSPSVGLGVGSRTMEPTR